MGHKVNIDCGTTLTEGYINLDNSWSIKIINFPLAYSVLRFLKLLNADQIKNIEWNKKNKIKINEYLKFDDANKFMSNLYVAPPFRNFREKITLFITGYRHHQWMYDDKSLGSLMKSVGFKDIVMLKSGETMIKIAGKLDLLERSSESLYAEAK